MIQGVELQGIMMSNHENKVFDNVVSQFVGVSKVAAGQLDGHGYARWIDTDGDLIFTQTIAAGPLGKPDWKIRFLHGTGKWKSITGGGEVTQITKRSPVVEGSFRGCYRLAGSFVLPK